MKRFIQMGGTIFLKSIAALNSEGESHFKKSFKKFQKNSKNEILLLRMHFTYNLILKKYESLISLRNKWNATECKYDQLIGNVVG